MWYIYILITYFVHPELYIYIITFLGNIPCFHLSMFWPSIGASLRFMMLSRHLWQRLKFFGAWFRFFPVFLKMGGFSILFRWCRAVWAILVFFFSREFDDEPSIFSSFASVFLVQTQPSHLVTMVVDEARSLPCNFKSKPQLGYHSYHISYIHVYSI